MIQDLNTMNVLYDKKKIEQKMLILNPGAQATIYQLKYSLL